MGITEDIANGLRKMLNNESYFFTNKDHDNLIRAIAVLEHRLNPLGEDIRILREKIDNNPEIKKALDFSTNK